MRRLLFSFLALAACDDTTIRVVHFNPADGPVIEEAAGILGLSYVPSDDHYGAITLDIIPVVEGPVQGRALVDDGCQRAGWAVRDPQVIAHELGHMLGLKHTDRKGNVMNDTPEGVGYELTDTQHDTIDRNVTKLSRC